jgi:hypothetical protein
VPADERKKIGTPREVRIVANCLINAEPCGPSTSAREGAGLWLEGSGFGRGVRKPDPLSWVSPATRMYGSAKHMQVVQNRCRVCRNRRWQPHAPGYRSASLREVLWKATQSRRSPNGAHAGYTGRG